MLPELFRVECREDRFHDSRAGDIPQLESPITTQPVCLLNIGQWKGFISGFDLIGSVQ